MKPWMRKTLCTALLLTAVLSAFYLRAAGDTRYTMVVSTASMWTLRVGLGMLLGHLGFGVLGIWMAMFADWLLRILFFLPRFHGHRWETMAVDD